MIDVYRTCVIDFQSEISSYDQINFDFNNDTRINEILAQTKFSRTLVQNR